MRYLPWQCESEGALCNRVPLLKILIKVVSLLRSTKHVRWKSGILQITWCILFKFISLKLPKLLTPFCFEGVTTVCFCFSWLPLIFNKVFFWDHSDMLHTERWLYLCLDRRILDIKKYQRILKLSHSVKKFWRGHICSKKSMAGAEFAFKLIVDWQNIRAFTAFKVCLAEAHSSLLVYTRRWEYYRFCDGKVMDVMVTSVADPVGWISPRYYLPIGSFTWHI